MVFKARAQLHLKSIIIVAAVNVFILFEGTNTTVQNCYSLSNSLGLNVSGVNGAARRQQPPFFTLCI